MLPNWSIYPWQKVQYIHLLLLFLTGGSHPRRIQIGVVTKSYRCWQTDIYPWKRVNTYFSYSSWRCLGVQYYLRRVQHMRSYPPRALPLVLGHAFPCIQNLQIGKDFNNYRTGKCKQSYTFLSSMVFTCSWRLPLCRAGGGSWTSCPPGWGSAQLPAPTPASCSGSGRGLQSRVSNFFRYLEIRVSNFFRYLEIKVSNFFRYLEIRVFPFYLPIFKLGLSFFLKVFNSGRWFFYPKVW